VERLLLPDDGVVFVTDEFSGRRFVIKVGGIECLKPRGRATAGGTVSAPEDLGGPVIWLFQCENAVSMQFWIEHIKTVINMQKCVLSLGCFSNGTDGFYPTERKTPV
jgi:hypothetical protein